MKTNSVRPEAYIAVGKNRQRIYGTNTVYLQNKQEFEFEFFNPTKDNIMARISINGKPISNSGLVLRPGVRGWIERYIDENRKFLFETYTVDGNSKAVQKAIEDNGDIKIEFFKEKPKPTLPIDWICKKFDINEPSRLRRCKSSTSDYTTCSASADYLGDVEYNTDSVSQKLSFNSSVDYAPEEMSRGICDSQSLRRKMSKSIETGRVEKGSASDQYFNIVDMEFEYLPFFTVYYKLMPASQKPAEFADFKLRCSNCKTKIKSNWKVCPMCGRVIDDDMECPNCRTKVEPAWNFCPTCNNPLK